MIRKLKYIFFDFSDNFKNDFIFTFKKAVVFFVVGVIGLIFAQASPVMQVVGGLGIIIFGLFWAKGIVAALTGTALMPKNIMFKLFALIFMYAACMILGYIYFAWGIVKMIVIAIKNIKKKSDEERKIKK